MQTEHNPTLKHHVLVLTYRLTQNAGRLPRADRIHYTIPHRVDWEPKFDQSVADMQGQCLSDVTKWAVVIRNCLYGKKNDRPLEHHSETMCTGK